MRSAASLPQPSLRSGTLGANVGAGLLSSVVMLCYALSYAALIFSGDLAQYLHAGVLVTLVSCIAAAPVIALCSSIRFSIGGPDGNSAAILAGMAGGIAAEMALAAGSAGAHGVLPTLLAALALSSVFTGVLLYLLGAAKGSTLIQFLPYPVMGGYLAGTGYLLLAGSFRVLTGQRLHWSHLDALASLPWLAWLPALVVCAVLMAGARYIKRFTLVVPIGIASGLLVFYAGLAASGMPAAQARQLGLLFDSVPLSALQLPMTLPAAQIDWHAIWHALPEFFVVAAVSALTILLNATGAGLACQLDPDLNQEMRAAGIANLLCGALGGIVGYQSLSRTLLNRRAGATGRSSGIAAAAGCLLVVLALPGLIGWMPKSVLVGLQLYIGIGLIQEWLIRSYRKLARAEYLLIPLIVVVIAVHDVVTGVGLGIIAACVLFVVRYGRVSVIRHDFDGRTLSSNVERSMGDTGLLRAHGDAVVGASLHGFLFFATANSILQHMRARLDAAAAPRYAVLDFRRINGLDASTSASFLKLRQACDGAGVTLVLTALPEAASELLARAGLFSPGVHSFASLDAGMEWIEDQLLAGIPHQQAASAGLQAHFGAAALARLKTQLAPRQLAAGERLFAQGDPGDAVYIVEYGRVTVSLPLAGGRALRLRSFGAGTIVGEMALYTRQPRSADVHADAPTLVHSLSLEALQRMEREDSETAQQFHRYVVNTLASRLATSNEAVRATY